MSELKTVHAFEVYDAYTKTGDDDAAQVYLKSEADKVIAELEQKLAAAQLVQRLNKPEALYSNLETMSRLTHEKYVVERRERHHKYKRCLANAEACMHKRWRTDEGFDYARSTRHMNKWLELAEKFKPNSTAQ